VSTAEELCGGQARCPSSYYVRYALYVLYALYALYALYVFYALYTDKKENEIFLIYKEIQNGAVAKSYL
jgi:hypothetical protein